MSANSSSDTLTAADDSFHPPASDDPYWTETAWFAFSDPDRKLTGTIYPVFRPNMGICSTSVNIWDDSTDVAHEVLYSKCWWHQPMPTEDLTQLRLPCGLQYRMLEPLTRYEVRFTDEDLSLDLRYEAMHPPYSPFAGEAGHLDQACHVTGAIDLGGEHIPIDCIEMRDRSWTVRSDFGQVRASYDYALSEDRCLLAMAVHGDDQDLVVAGYHYIDGTVRSVASGSRTVERIEGRPARVCLQVTDAAGEEIEATGDCVNRFAFQSSPNYFAWMSLTRWTIDGSTMWGEDQDVWSPDLLRADRRTR